MISLNTSRGMLALSIFALLATCGCNASPEGLEQGDGNVGSATAALGCGTAKSAKYFIGVNPDGGINFMQTDGTMWPSYDGPVLSGYDMFIGMDSSFAGDGFPSVIARKSDGTLWLYHVEPGYPQLHAVWAPVKFNSGWQIFDQIITTGDFDGDGVADLIARNPTNGTLWLYRGNGHGGLYNGGTQFNSGWNVFDELVGMKDFDCDGFGDIIARNPTDGSLRLYRGNGHGGLYNDGGTKFNIGWNAFDAILEGGDKYQDGSDGLIARKSDGTLWYYRGNGSGGLVQGGYTQILPSAAWEPPLPPDLAGTFDPIGTIDNYSLAYCGSSAGDYCCAPSDGTNNAWCDPSWNLYCDGTYHCRVTQPVCGGSGEACCSGGTCNSGLICNAGTCSVPPCGGSGEACCSGGSCGSGMICSSGTCQTCGGLFDPCCPGNTCGNIMVGDFYPTVIPLICHLNSAGQPMCDWDSDNDNYNCNGVGDWCCNALGVLECATTNYQGLRCNGATCDFP